MKKLLLALTVLFSFSSAIANYEYRASEINILKKELANSGIHQVLNGTQEKSCVQKTLQQCVDEYNACLNSTGPWGWGACFQQLDTCGIECL